MTKHLSQKKFLTYFIVLFFLTISLLIMSYTVNASNGLTLTAQDQGSISPSHENYIKLTWNGLPTAKNEESTYTIYISSDGGINWETRSTMYKKQIKVLNVYPEGAFDESKNQVVGNGNYLEAWMGKEPNDPGRGLIDVTPVPFKAFNKDANGILKDATTGKYKYDVIMFGSSDLNGGPDGWEGDLTKDSGTALENYIKTGRGVLFGHDIAINANWGNYPDNGLPKSDYLPIINSLAVKYFGIAPIYKPFKYDDSRNELFYVTGDTIKASTKTQEMANPFLLQYPWPIDKKPILNVPTSHSTNQYVFSSGTKNGTIWLEYAKSASNPWTKPHTLGSESTNNFYLYTNNNANDWNTAMIQTGHTTGESSEDEKQVLANTLMYLAQVTIDIYADDYSARDVAKPDIPTAFRNDDKSISFFSNDNGTTYNYKVRGKTTNLTSGTEVFKDTSDIVTTTTKTTVKEYYIIEDNDPNGAPTQDGLQKSGVTVISSSSDGSSVNYMPKTSIYNFVHIQAVDYAGNLSPVTTIDPIFINVRIDAETTKIYKPERLTLTAKVDKASNVVVDPSDVKYIMLPLSDTNDYSTQVAFENKLSQLTSDSGYDDDYYGKMHQVGGNDTYNIYSSNDPSLNGITDNCVLWIMVKGSSSSGDVVSIAKHEVNNIYTPINVYHEGINDSTSKSIYNKLRVGGLDVYGLPLDLMSDTVISNLPYDTINLEYETEGISPHWKLTSGSQQNEVLTLNDSTFRDKLYTFNFEKDLGYWFDVMFKFRDFNGEKLNTLELDRIESKFSPQSGGFGIPFYTEYTPPDVASYKAIGYIKSREGDLFDINDIKYVDFPVGFGYDTLDPGDVITIVYAQAVFEVTQKYHVYVGDNQAAELFSDSIANIPSTKKYICTPPKINGYVYCGYSTDGGTNWIDVDFTQAIPEIPPDYTAIGDTTIIYKYKKNSTNTQVPDELERLITVKGVGIDAKGKRTDLYSEKTPTILGHSYTATPKGTPLSENPYGTKSYVYNEDTWILTSDIKLNALVDQDQFFVTDNRTIVFYYYKDTGSSGVPDFFEANITVKHLSADDTDLSFPTISDLLLTEFSYSENYETEAIHIAGYAPWGVRIYNDGDAPTSANITEPNIAKIEPIGTSSWIVEFLYKPDTNNNGIIDDSEGTINVEVKRTYLSNTQGINETITSPISIIERGGETLRVDPNDYVDGMDYLGATITIDTSNRTSPANIVPIDELFVEKKIKTITLSFKQKAMTAPPPPDNGGLGSGNGGSSGGNGGSGSGSSMGGGDANNEITTPPTVDEKPQTNPDINTQKPPNNLGVGNSGGNSYSWASFYKPEKIFIDDELIPLGSLIFNGPYIYGYSDATVQPNGNLTRAEAVQMIYNLYGKPYEQFNLEADPPYKDVKKSDWYAKAVSFTAEHKIALGYPDGSFLPHKQITRAELVVLLTNYKNITNDTTIPNFFPDTLNHWANNQINTASKNNFINGYPDSTFRPNNLVTRSETVTIINTILRRPEKWIGVNKFPDLVEDIWSYKNLMNAVNGYAED